MNQPDVERDWNDCVQHNDVRQEDEDSDDSGSPFSRSRTLLRAPGDVVVPREDALELVADVPLPDPRPDGTEQADGEEEDEDLQRRQGDHHMTLKSSHDAQSIT